MIQTAVFSRVDVRLRENFINRIDCADGTLVRVRHALDFNTAFFVFNVDGEEVPQVENAEALVDFNRVLFVHELRVILMALPLFLGPLPHFLHLDVRQMLVFPLLHLTIVLNR